MIEPRCISALRMFVLVGFMIAVMAGAARGAELVNFSLAPSESVTVGGYTLIYRGLTGIFPTYDLYSEGVLRAHFPVDTAHPYDGVYTYENVTIRTTEIRTNGLSVTGTLTVN